jgi:hypothetical protein
MASRVGWLFMVVSEWGFVYRLIFREEDSTGPGHLPLVPHYHGGTALFQNQYLFCVVVPMERNSLSGRHGFDQNEKILCIPILLGDLNCERPTASRTCAARGDRRRPPTK